MNTFLYLACLFLYMYRVSKRDNISKELRTVLPQIVCGKLFFIDFYNYGLDVSLYDREKKGQRKGWGLERVRVRVREM